MSNTRQVNMVINTCPPGYQSHKSHGKVRSLLPFMLLAILFITVSFSGLSAQFTNGQAAIGILGQKEFTTNTSGTSARALKGPNGLAIDPLTGKLFVADRSNHRILRWSSEQALVNGSEAEAVLGQPDFVTGSSGLAANKLNNPIGIHLDQEGRLWVGDYSNQRVLRFDNASTKPTGADADAVLGQTDFTTNTSGVAPNKFSGPVGVYVDTSGTLWVTNFSSHSVVRFDQAAQKANGAAADGILGQPDFTTNTSGITANKMNGPNGVYVDLAGRVWVSDYANRRVLRFDDAAHKSNGADADGVLGQPDFVTNSANVSAEGSGYMRYVTGDPGGRLYSVQESTNRLMIYNNAAALPNGAPADFVLGQPDFTSSAALNPPTAASFNVPRAAVVDHILGILWVADWSNNRVLRFELQPAGSAALTLLTPNGGEVWFAGSIENITWASNHVKLIKLEYRVDNGSAWTLIADSVNALSQSYPWKIPDSPTTEALVRITDVENSSLSDVSQATFTISAPYSEVRLLSPNGYQQWGAGSKRKILFTSINVKQANLEFSANHGASWTAITTTAAASSAFEWTVPDQTSNQYLIRISNHDDLSVADTSDHTFSVVEKRAGGEQDFIFFSDSPTPNFYDPSWGYATAPSALELVGDKFPVTTQYSLVGNYALKLNWSSRLGGDWAVAAASIGWVGRDVTTKDTLELKIFSEDSVSTTGLPYIFVEDLNNRKSTKLALNTFVEGITRYSWQKVTIPIKAFVEHPGSADLTRIKTIFFSQYQPDTTQHQLFLDDIRLTGGQPIVGDTTRIIVVLGSSTAAGTGPTSPDSAWVNRYRKYILALAPTAKVINLAIGGYTTYDIMPTGSTPPSGRPTPKPNNNITYAMTYKPSAMIINLPSNDAAQNIPIAEQLANYDVILAHAKQVPVWITTPQPRNFASQSQRNLLIFMRDSTYARFGERTIDFWTGIAKGDGTINPLYNSGDGVHINNAGHRIFFQRVVDKKIWDDVTQVETEAVNTTTLPLRFELMQNYPNPFNPETNIEYDLPSQADVRLSIFNAAGKEVNTIMSGYQNAGRFKLRWDASKLSSGIYFYLLTVKANGQVQYRQSRKMVYIK